MSDLNDDDKAALLRWRLALGPQAERGSSHSGQYFGLGGLKDQAGSCGCGDDVGDVDGALDFVYGEGQGPGGKKGGRGGSNPWLPRWLELLKRTFDGAACAFVQKDAIERKGLTELLFGEDTLPYLEKNVDLVVTLLEARGMVPDEAKERARAIIRAVVDELRKKLEIELRTAILGALRKDLHSPLQVARNLDWKRTIQKNLRGWDRDKKRLVPEKFHFFAAQRRRHEWDVVLVVDQSGSMAESVVYSSVMAAIFASLDVLRTQLIFFDTEIVDATPLLVDPVDVLFATQLGGGTDINRAVAYAAENCVSRPDKTMFLVVTDLEEGGDAASLVVRMRALVEARVRVMVLLALTDSGHPSYNTALAAELTAIGVPCFGCTPNLLARVMERVLSGQDPSDLVARA
ncbi:MAG: VWA domain-containing protein [Deltaproteobacteria bacterium]|nr:VWA domain-containing protein [Deltaproteobacteria bacterium]